MKAPTVFLMCAVLYGKSFETLVCRMISRRYFRASNRDGKRKFGRYNKRKVEERNEQEGKRK